MWVVLILPFLGTVLGSSLVFFNNKKSNIKFQKMSLSLAAGIMLAASIWSLIIPAIELSNHLGMLSCLPVSVGIICGVLFLFFMEKAVIKKTQTDLLNFAIVLHNVPEGIATGLVAATIINTNNNLLILSAISFSIGIAIQNIPEGFAISLPYNAIGKSKCYSFFKGVLSGIVEPIFGFIAIIIGNSIGVFLPVLFGFAAGSMIYVVIKELIPKTQEKEYSNIGVFGTVFGFLIMMILDVILG